MSDPVEILTRDLSSGRIHKRYRLGESLLTDERDNLDDAGAFDIITQAELADASPGDLCERCFPQREEKP